MLRYQYFLDFFSDPFFGHVADTRRMLFDRACRSWFETKSQFIYESGGADHSDGIVLNCLAGIADEPDDSEFQIPSPVIWVRIFTQW